MSQVLVFGPKKKKVKEEKIEKDFAVEEVIEKNKENEKRQKLVRKKDNRGILRSYRIKGV